MLEALAGRDRLALAYDAALAHHDLWHEFGDLHLLFWSGVKSLKQPEDVAGGIVEATDLRGLLADRSNDVASFLNDGIDGRGHVVDQHEDEQTGFGRWRPTNHPGASQCARCVFESAATVRAFRDPPTEHLDVEVGRSLDVDSGNLDVAHLTVHIFPSHQDSPGFHATEYTTSKVTGTITRTKMHEFVRFTKLAHVRRRIVTTPNEYAGDETP